MRIAAFILLLLSVLVSIDGWSQMPQLVPQTGHAAPVTDLVFDPTGRLLASASEDRNIVIWDMRSGKQMVLLSGHTDRVNAIAFSPDGKLLASASSDGSVLLWNIAAGSVYLRFDGFANKVMGLAYHPEGKKLYCSTDSVFELDFDNGSRTKLPLAANKQFTALAIDPEGRFLAVGGLRERHTVVWSFSRGEIVRSFLAHANKLAFVQGHDVLLIADQNGKLKRLRLDPTQLGRNFRITAQYIKHAFTAVAESNDYFIGANTNSDIYLYKKRTGKLRKTLKGHTAAVRALAISPNGKYLASAGDDRLILVWNMENFAMNKIFRGSGSQINDLAFSVDGSTMLINYQDGYSRLWNLQELGAVITLNTPARRGLGSTRPYSANATLPNIYEKRQVVIAKEHYKNANTGKTLRTKEHLRFWLPDTALGFAAQHSKLIRNNKFSDYRSLSISDSLLTLYRLRTEKVPPRSLLNRDYKPPVAQVYGMRVAQRPLNQNTKLKGRLKSAVSVPEDIVCKNTSPSGRLMGVIYFRPFRSNQAEVWDLQTGRKLLTSEVDKTVHFIGFDGNDSYVYTISTAMQQVFLMNLLSGERIKLAGGYPLAFNNNSTLLAFSDAQQQLHLYDLGIGALQYSVSTGHSSAISTIKFNEQYGYLATGSLDGLIKFWNTGSGEHKLSLMAMGKSDFIYITPQNYYYSTKGAQSSIGFRIGTRVYAFEQFDLRYNRPDKVLEQLGYSKKEDIQKHHKIYLKRLKRLGFTEDRLADGTNIPQAHILGADTFPLATNFRNFGIEVEASDSLYNLDRFNVWINRVPIYGKNGVSVEHMRKHNLKRRLNLVLSEGVNLVEFMAMNSAGAESYRDEFEIVCKPYEKSVSKLHVIALGVSEYDMDKGQNLPLAQKDAADFVQLFKANRRFKRTLNTTLLLNNEVTVSNMAELKEQLAKTDVEDRVLLFYAGHGILNRDYDYYLGSYDIDFRNPEKKGILFDDFEDLLDSIPARRKVMFVDACHSGELEKDEVEAVDEARVIKKKISFRGFVAIKQVQHENNLLEMSKLVFSDIRRGTGSTVMSSAGGTQYALESEEWGNGVFTFCLKEGLSKKDADIDRDGNITIKELKIYLGQKVPELTQGSQQPTSRSENELLNDFQIW